MSFQPYFVAKREYVIVYFVLNVVYVYKHFETDFLDEIFL